MLKKLCAIAILVSIGLFTISATGCSKTPTGEPKAGKSVDKVEQPKEGDGASAAVE